jgi:hypothetical protein
MKEVGHGDKTILLVIDTKLRYLVFGMHFSFKINEKVLGNTESFSYISIVMREIDMTREMFLEGIGWVLETTYFRLNADNNVEPYTEYELINR